MHSDNRMFTVTDPPSLVSLADYRITLYKVHINILTYTSLNMIILHGAFWDAFDDKFHSC